MHAGSGVGQLAGFATVYAASGEPLLVIGLIIKQESLFSLLAVPGGGAWAPTSKDQPAVSKTASEPYELKWVKNQHLRAPVGDAWRYAVQFSARDLPALDEVLKRMEAYGETSIFEKAISTESEHGEKFKKGSPVRNTAGMNSSPPGLGDVTALTAGAKTLQKELFEQREILKELMEERRRPPSHASKSASADGFCAPLSPPLSKEGNHHTQKLLKETAGKRHLWGEVGVEEDLESSDDDESDVEDLETLFAKAAASAGGRADAGTVDTNSLIQWEIVKALGKLNRKKESDSEEDEPRGAGTASGFAGIRKLRRRLRKAPRSVLARYCEHVKQKLGVRHAAHRWEYCDYSTQLLPTFGKIKGLWRCRHLMSDILQLLEGEETDQAIGLKVQGLKALHHAGSAPRRRLGHSAAAVAGRGPAGAPIVRRRGGGAGSSVPLQEVAARAEGAAEQQSRRQHGRRGRGHGRRRHRGGQDEAEGEAEVIASCSGVRGGPTPSAREPTAPGLVPDPVPSEARPENLLEAPRGVLLSFSRALRQMDHSLRGSPLGRFTAWLRRQSEDSLQTPCTKSNVWTSPSSSRPEVP